MFVQTIVMMLTMVTSVCTQIPCTVTFVANEGFLIETKNHKVLIDALFNCRRNLWWVDIKVIDKLKPAVGK
jgi:hypothetical protein